MKLKHKFIVGFSVAVGLAASYSFVNLSLRNEQAWVAENPINYECKKSKNGYLHILVIDKTKSYHAFSGADCLPESAWQDIVTNESTRILTDGVTFFSVKISGDEAFKELKSNHNLMATKYFSLIVALMGFYYAFKRFKRYRIK